MFAVSQKIVPSTIIQLKSIKIIGDNAYRDNLGRLIRNKGNLPKRKFPSLEKKKSKLRSKSLLKVGIKQAQQQQKFQQLQISKRLKRSSVRQEVIDLEKYRKIDKIYFQGEKEGGAQKRKGMSKSKVNFKYLGTRRYRHRDPYSSITVQKSLRKNVLYDINHTLNLKQSPKKLQKQYMAAQNPILYTFKSQYINSRKIVQKVQGTKLKLLDKKLKYNQPSIGIYKNTKRFFFKRPRQCVIFKEHVETRKSKAYKLMRKLQQIELQKRMEQRQAQRSLERIRVPPGQVFMNQRLVKKAKFTELKQKKNPQMYTNGFIKDFDNFFDDYTRNFRQQLRKIKMELKKSDY